MTDKRDLAARKFDAMLNVAIDSDLPKLATRIMVLIAARYMNADHGGEAWPSIATLRRDLNIASDAAVRKALSALVANRHLVAEHRPGATTRYKLPSEQNPASKYTGVEKHTPPTFEADTPIQNEATNTGERIPENEPRRMNTGKEIDARAFELSSASERPSKRRKHPSKADPPPDGFEDFWRTYPRRVGKAAAKRAYTAALKGGATSQDIILGAARYAAARDAEPDQAKRERFTAHPSTWISAGRWADEPALASTDKSSFDPGAPRQDQRGNQREGHGFRVMRMGEFT